MIVFLTSSPSGSLDDSHKVNGLDETNYFVDNLRKYWKECAKCLMITASPDAYEVNDEMIAFFAQAMKGQNVVFLYLANNSPDVSWKNTIKKYKLLGEQVVHYNLLAK